MTHCLPPSLQRLFEPRESLSYAIPLDRDPNHRRGPVIDPVTNYLCVFDQNLDIPGTTIFTAPQIRRRQKTEEQNKIQKELINLQLKDWDPTKDPKIKGDPFKTLFVSRLDYQVNEEMLRQTFSRYGPIQSISLVKHNATGASRGYAFIEFEHERDMRAAFKDADGIRLQGRRIVVDCERGRAVKNWCPRRLGGGLGATRLGVNHENIKTSGRTPFGNLEEKKKYDQQHTTTNAKPLASSHGQDTTRDNDDHRDHYARRDDRERRDYRDHDRDRNKDRDRGYDRDKDCNRDRDRERDRYHRDTHNRNQTSTNYRERERDHHDQDHDQPLFKKPRVSAPVEDGEIV